MNRIIITGSQSSTASGDGYMNMGATGTDSLGGQTSGAQGSGPQPDTANAKIEKAVYAHIRALRALGRTTVNTVEIARALGIAPRDVEKAVEGLKSKGVKVAA